MQLTTGRVHSSGAVGWGFGLGVWGRGLGSSRGRRLTLLALLAALLLRSPLGRRAQGLDRRAEEA